MNSLIVPMLVLSTLIVGCSGASTPPPAASPEPGSHAERATLSIAVANASGIQTAIAAPGLLTETVLLYGTIQPSAERTRAIAARFPGVIRSVTRELGDQVKAGETLATVESNESLQVYAVTSPQAGMITQRHANPGEVAGAGPLFEVADYGRVRAALNIFPRDRARVRLGQSIRITPADGDTGADSKVDFIAPVGNAQNQSVTVRASLENLSGTWTPGQFITGELAVTEARAAVVVLPEALQRSQGRDVLFVQSPAGFAMRAVQIGRRGQRAVEITQGLAAGERYVTTGSFLVKAELTKSEAAEE